MGHSFGLPHTGDGWNYPDAGASLMGHGNSTYGDELRHEGKGAYLAPTDALKLASVPLFKRWRRNFPQTPPSGVCSASMSRGLLNGWRPFPSRTACA
ncbi:MAG: hypothetical protein ACLSUW_11040 [Akkermansia sp.]